MAGEGEVFAVRVSRSSRLGRDAVQSGTRSWAGNICSTRRLLLSSHFDAEHGDRVLLRNNEILRVCAMSVFRTQPLL